MWGFFGDQTPGPAGTYYRGSSEMVEQFWHIFDQVLLRPALMYKITDLTIVDNIAGQSLLSSGDVPSKNTYSDHLPISFQLGLE